MTKNKGYIAQANDGSTNPFGVQKDKSKSNPFNTPSASSDLSKDLSGGTPASRLGSGEDLDDNQAMISVKAVSMRPRDIFVC